MLHPNPQAKELHHELLMVSDHLYHRYKDKPEVRQILQLDGVPKNGEMRRSELMNKLWKMGSGEEEANRDFIDDVRIMISQHYDLANLLMPPAPPAPPRDPNKPGPFDFLKNLQPKK